MQGYSQHISQGWDYCHCVLSNREVDPIREGQEYCQCIVLVDQEGEV